MCILDLKASGIGIMLSFYCVVPTLNRVATCLENLEMSGNLTAVREMSGILLKVREMTGKSCMKLFIVGNVGCMFASIQVFSRSLFCVKY